ncbi:mechanosensitive ion channel family protein [Halospeciosus flavus]|uniref:Mechanosensitive ion channel family protein n=1 Tax=Halospeciosus flavus TaxID=3032283 RepID=A0ABD5Z600_9EURY|nr:mechanosensitive ion channel domain-containing protein [Halospeciosus flavus]
MSFTFPGWLVDLFLTYQGHLSRFGGFLVAATVVYTVGRLLVVPSLVRASRLRNPENPALVAAVESYAEVFLLVVAFAAGLVGAGFGSLLTKSAVVAAAITVVVGVAGQEVFGNLVAGAFLVADPDFDVGDYIEWNDRAGSVEAVDFRVTRVRTTADEVVTVPNAELATNAIQNPYARGRYRVTEELSVALADLDRATELLREAAAADDRVLDEPSPTVIATGFGESTVSLTVLLWVADPDHDAVWAVKDAFLRRVAERSHEAGVTVNPASKRLLAGSVDVDAGGATDGRAASAEHSD